MKKFRLQCKNFLLNFIINKYKVLFCEDLIYYHNIYKLFTNIFKKKVRSDYAIENDLEYLLFLNDSKINLNDFMYFEVTDDFNVDEDLKMGSKSLTLNYLNSIFKDIEFNDDYQNILTILNSLSYEFDDSILDMIIKLNTYLNIKNLTKLFCINILKEDNEINSLDYNYNEILILQLKMISIISKSIDKNTLIFVKVPFITNEIIKYIEKLDCITIILTNYIPYNSENLCIINSNIIIDLDDQEAIYDIYLNTNHNYEDSFKFKQHIIDKYINSRKINL